MPELITLIWGTWSDMIDFTQNYLLNDSRFIPNYFINLLQLLKNKEQLVTKIPCMLFLFSDSWRTGVKNFFLRVPIVTRLKRWEILLNLQQNDNWLDHFLTRCIPAACILILMLFSCKHNIPDWKVMLELEGGVMESHGICPSHWADLCKLQMWWHVLTALWVKTQSM